MIYDNINNYLIYMGLGERIANALQYIVNTDFQSKDIGRDEIDGDSIFAIISDYKTRLESEAKMESHKKYIDLQYVVSGKEKIGYASLVNQEPISEYNDENDFLLYDSDRDYLSFTKGQFAIFFPQDIHMPGIILTEPEDVRKVVVKIKI